MMSADRTTEHDIFQPDQNLLNSHNDVATAPNLLTKSKGKGKGKRHASKKPIESQEGCESQEIKREAIRRENPR